MAKQKPKSPWKDITPKSRRQQRTIVMTAAEMKAQLRAEQKAAKGR